VRGRVVVVNVIVVPTGTEAGGLVGVVPDRHRLRPRFPPEPSSERRSIRRTELEAFEPEELEPPPHPTPMKSATRWRKAPWISCSLDTGRQRKRITNHSDERLLIRSGIGPRVGTDKCANQRGGL